MSNKLAKKYAIIRYNTEDKIWNPANLDIINWDSDHPQSVFKTETRARKAIIDYINKRYPSKYYSKETKRDYLMLYDVCIT